MYTYVSNNPLKYVDPSGHIGIPMAPTPAMTCAASPGQCKTILKGQAEAGKTLLVEGANFLILDDVNTLLNPDGSLNEKALTVASFLPWGKVLKAGKVVSKVNKASESLTKFQGWIKRDTYKEIVDRFGKDAAKKFSNSMKKGLVSGQGENSVKRLGDGVKIGNKTYKFEVKIKGQYGDWRVFGNYDEKSGHYIFDLFDKGKH